MSTTKTDDLEAIRVVVEAIKDFKTDDQQRILRWVAEKLGMPQPFASVTPGTAQSAGLPFTPPPAPPGSAPGAGGAQDIKSFVTAKKPRNDVQFAATVAYYFRFEAPQAERKDVINKDDLQEACRKASRDRLNNPLQTLHNAHTLGLLDKGSEKATFSINSVGENLVAMTLPGDGSSVPKARSKKNAGKKAFTKKKMPRKAKKA